MIVIGIDPGSVNTGYGVLEKNGSKLRLIEYGVIKAKKKNENFPLRLKEIFERLNSVIERTLPDEAAIESMFYHKNAQTLMKLSHARGVAMLSATLKEIPVMEYAPMEIKKSVTGRGAASKEQVQFMVKRILNIDETPEFFDVTDALAVAICHSTRRTIGVNKTSNWNDFIKNNPSRVKY